MIRFTLYNNSKEWNQNRTPAILQPKFSNYIDYFLPSCTKENNLIIFNVLPISLNILQKLNIPKIRNNNKKLNKLKFLNDLNN